MAPHLAKQQVPDPSSRPALSHEESGRSGARHRRAIGPGSVLGGYHIEAKLGAGGMAEVFSARREGPHGFSKRVAVKRILPSAAEDDAFVKMFIEEAALAARLSHPNIVQVFDFGDDDGELFLAMELVEGTSLGRLLRAVASRRQALPLHVALYLTAQTARALDYAHRLRRDSGEPFGLVHRDVSPGNLLLTRTGHLKLADFGIACTSARERHTGNNDLRGKLGYMSPEQVQGLPLDGKSDVFTLTVILAELLMGRPLFAGGAQLDVLLRIRDVDLRPLEQSDKRIPSDVRRVLRDGLKSDPKERPDAKQLAATLESICARRGFPADASAQVSRLMASYELCPPGHHEENEAPARPTSRFDPIEGEAFVGGTLETSTGAVVSPLDLAPRHAYYPEIPRGGQTGSVSFPELMRLATTGEIDALTLVRRGRETPRPAAELPELARVFSTPALQWAREEISRPRLRGDLNGAALLPIVNSLARNRESGVLYLEDGKRKKKIYFVDGRPDFVASTMRDEMLGQYLVDKGVCLPMEVDMGLAVLPQHKGRLGDALVSLGVLRPVELYRAVASQVRGRYLDAFKWRRGEFLYVRNRKSQEETYPIEQDAHVLMRDACLALHASELEAALAPLWEKVIRPPLEPTVSASAYQLPDSWRWVLSQARGDQTVGSLFARCTMQSGLDAEDAMRALFLAISCRLLETA
ncbi:MAG TPA: protein kinase [Polyangiales bacterium]|nr:protein kinase [Polyangiales bacterium]